MLIHTGLPNNQLQQRVPPTQIWSLEHPPITPRPSAPSQLIDGFHTDCPPPYEKICANR
jgi:hypothetical protein